MLFHAVAREIHRIWKNFLREIRLEVEESEMKTAIIFENLSTIKRRDRTAIK